MAWQGAVGVMSLRECLQQIYDERGQLTPAAVVDVARDAAHPLHERFEWDDSVAGEAWRRVQAQELIRSVKVIYREPTETEEGRSVRSWVSVRRENGNVYEPAQAVAEDPFTRQLVMRDMEREWKALHRRYAHFREFVDLVREDITEKAA